MQMKAVTPLLKTTHWASRRYEQQEWRAMEHSFRFGARDCQTGEQIAFAYVVTDYGTTYRLCDVVAAPAWQRRGVGCGMQEAIQSDPLFRDLRGILVSRDAQAFYAKFGSEKSDRSMVKLPK